MPIRSRSAPCRPSSSSVRADATRLRPPLWGWHSSLAAAAHAARGAGAWSPVATDPADPNAKLPLRYERPHFAFHWAGDFVSADVARSAGAPLETVQSCFLGTLDFPEPDCSLPAKRRANVFIDSSYGLTGDGVDAGNIGRPRRVCLSLDFCWRGGAEGNRTPDLCSAIAALSHLSYSPAACLRYPGRRSH